MAKRRSRAALGVAALISALLLSGGRADAIAFSTLHVSFSRIASGLSSPVAMGMPNDGSGRLFFVEQAGRVKVRQPNGTIGTYLDISSKVNSSGTEQGMLGIAFHPSFTSNRYVFVSYTDSGGTLVVARFQAASIGANSVAPGTETDVISVPHPNYQNHNGGQLAFGTDGYLYIGTGDGGGAGDPYNNAHDTTKLAGKILRIDINRTCGSPPDSYCVPSGNPFHNAVWEYGLRNPWRFSFDRSGGSLWVGDVGQNSWEEIDHVGKGVGGKNFGWDCWEGTHEYPPGGPQASYCTPLSTTVQPVAQYDHNSGDCAVIGGFIYRGSRYSANMAGVYLYGDYCSGVVRGYYNGSQRVLYRSGQNITSFGQDTSGELYATAQNGGVYHVTASGGVSPPPPPATHHSTPAPQKSTPSPSPKRTSSATPSAPTSSFPAPSPSGTVDALATGRGGGGPWPWIGIGLGLSALFGLGVVVARRRRT